MPFSSAAANIFRACLKIHTQDRVRARLHAPCPEKAAFRRLDPPTNPERRRNAKGKGAKRAKSRAIFTAFNPSAQRVFWPKPKEKIYCRKLLRDFKSSSRKVIGFTIRLSKQHCVRPERFEFFSDVKTAPHQPTQSDTEKGRIHLRHSDTR